MNKLALTISTLVLGTVFSATPYVRAGDDAKPGDAPAAGGDKPGGDKGDRPRRQRGGDNPGGQNGQNAGGRGFGGGQGGPGGPGGGPGGMMGGRNTLSMASRMLGIDIEDPKASPKLDSLPLGTEKRLVLSVPVGGIDNPGGQGMGWKVETVFKMTAEQVKAVEVLRDEYKVEEKKVDQEILDQQKVLAEKVKQLRLKFEQRANDVLTGDDKAAKEKMDALAKETNAKNATAVAEVLPMFDANDMTQGFAMIRMIREKTNVNVKSAEEKLVELVPAENRDRIKEVVHSQAAAREQMGRFMQGGGRGGPGGRGPGGGEPQKPPAPPEQNQKKDF